MALNNNYGFKILGKDGVSLNGKWPIFGFDVQNYQNAFRTTRIVDNSLNLYNPNSGVTVPTDNEMVVVPGPDGVTRTLGQNITSGTIKKLVSRYEHGYDYIPSGYYTVTGNIVLETKAIIVQAGSGSSYVEFYGGDFSREGYHNCIPSGNVSAPLYPTMNGFYPLDYGLSPLNYILFIKFSTDASNNPDIVIPGGIYGNPFVGTGLGVTTDNNSTDAPAAYITVEIDKKYVNIYMNYRWYDQILRAKAVVNYNQELWYDVTNRTRMVAETTGSVFNVNVYLTPHKLEEMIING